MIFLFKWSKVNITPSSHSKCKILLNPFIGDLYTVEGLFTNLYQICGFITKTYALVNIQIVKLVRNKQLPYFLAVRGQKSISQTVLLGNYIK